MEAPRYPDTGVGILQENKHSGRNLEGALRNLIGFYKVLFGFYKVLSS